jgi:hypothetical protein
MWKERSRPNLKNYTGIYLKVLKKTTKTKISCCVAETRPKHFSNMNQKLRHLNSAESFALWIGPTRREERQIPPPLAECQNKLSAGLSYSME